MLSEDLRTDEQAEHLDLNFYHSGVTMKFKDLYQAEQFCGAGEDEQEHGMDAGLIAVDPFHFSLKNIPTQISSLI